MKQASLHDLRKYFESVEARYNAKMLNPMSNEGNQILDQLLSVYEQIKPHAHHLEEVAKTTGNKSDIDALLDIIDFRTRLALLMGKFVGFGDGVNFLLVRAGDQGQGLL